jgi:hypothetical protein
MVFETADIAPEIPLSQRKTLLLGLRIRAAALDFRGSVCFFEVRNIA